MKRKKEPTVDDLLNGWLTPYHNTTIEQVDKEWVGEKDARIFYSKYPVTQDQHDEWYDWAIDLLSSYFKWSKEFTKKQFCLAYLNCAPTIIKENSSE